VIRTLLLCNAERGNEATGFFGSDMKIWKRAMSPLNALAGSKLNKYLQRGNDLWFIAGHTRLGTRGQNTRDNAHPFKYGTFIGSHNGIVDAPNSYAVDSMYLIDQLHKSAGDYQKGLGEVGGYWSIAWTDGTSFYLQVHRQSLAIAKIEGVWYYSSDRAHLKAALGCTEYHEFTEGETLRFTHNAETGETVISKLPALTHEPEKFRQWDSRTQGSSGSCGFQQGTGSTYSRGYSRSNSSGTSEDYGKAYIRNNEGKWVPVNEDEAELDSQLRDIIGDVTDAEIPDYDSRWREAWAEYNTEYNSAQAYG
jgi:hypothetical protein